MQVLADVPVITVLPQNITFCLVAVCVPYASTVLDDQSCCTFC
jgi:hypothetical protein